jgi:hypothetical protein
VVRLGAVGVATVVLFGGCGGGSSGSASSTSTSANATHETPTIQQPGAQPGSLTTVKQRLSAAGYSPEDRSVSGNALKSVEVDGVSIDSYRTAAAATADYGGMRALDRQYPGRGVARLVGTHLYSFEQERQLTPAERARFAKIVSVAEARR